MMQDILSSPGSFEAMVRIDFCYFQIKQIEKKLSKRTGIDRLIDESIGYEKELYQSLIENIMSIVKDKEFLNIDAAVDKEALINFETAFNKIYNI